VAGFEFLHGGINAITMDPSLDNQNLRIRAMRYRQKRVDANTSPIPPARRPTPSPPGRARIIPSAPCD